MVVYIAIDMVGRRLIYMGRELVNGCNNVFYHKRERESRSW